MSSDPIRTLREGLATALDGLAVETYDTLPDAAIVPCAVVGIPAITPGANYPLFTFSTTVTLVGERGDFTAAQLRLDSLVWEAFTILRTLHVETFSSWVVSGFPRPLEVAGHTHPAYELSVAATLPC